GQLSYAWYLWHWPLLVMARASELDERLLSRDIGLALIALGLAELTRMLIENPIRFGRPLPFRSARAAIVSGLCLSLAVAVGGGAMGLHARGLDSGATGQGALKTTCNGFVPRERCSIGAFGGSPGILLWGD